MSRTLLSESHRWRQDYRQLSPWYQNLTNSIIWIPRTLSKCHELYDLNLTGGVKTIVYLAHDTACHAFYREVWREGIHMCDVTRSYETWHSLPCLLPWGMTRGHSYVWHNVFIRDMIQPAMPFHEVLHVTWYSLSKSHELYHLNIKSHELYHLNITWLNYMWQDTACHDFYRDRPTQSMIHVPSLVNRFQNMILLIVQYKYLKSCSGDFILQNLILRTRSCGTGFITHSSWVLHFPWSGGNILYHRGTSSEGAYRGD